MEQKNIFEGAKFGDKFINRKGQIALYVNHQYDFNGVNLEEVFLEDREIVIVREDGVYDFDTEDHIGEPNELDIVGKYVEPIDEEKLDKITEDYSKWKLFFDDVLKSAFKAGYRKAKEE